MKLFEISDYLKAIDDFKKEKMESERLWTFYTILPHIDQKKVKSPQDMFPFRGSRTNRERQAKTVRERRRNVL